jgi:hypothetical protein
MNEQILFSSLFRLLADERRAVLSFVLWINIKYSILDNKGELKVNSRAHT